MVINIQPGGDNVAGRMRERYSSQAWTAKESEHTLQPLEQKED